MPRLTKHLFLLVLFSLILGNGALAKERQIAPPPNVAPQWAPVPEVPGVYYAPNSRQDFFQYGNQFYYFNQGVWQIARALTGPWQTIANPPQIFYDIGPTYFKNPPGWAKGRKTGWGGAPLPPGQMKKFGPGGHLPPGQIKKIE